MEKRKGFGRTFCIFCFKFTPNYRSKCCKRALIRFGNGPAFFLTCLAVNKYSRGRNRDARWRRRVWAWPRPQNWFDVLLVSPGMESLSKPYFQMSRKTYDELCNVFRADLIKQDTRMRRPVSVEKRMAVGLWRLANRDTYMKNSYIRFPYTDEEVQEIMIRFEEEYHFPQIAGATGDSHIEIRTPSDNHEYY